MNPVTEDIKDVLVEKGLGVFNSRSSTDFSIHTEVEPDSPDLTITLIDIGGPPPQGYANRQHRVARASGFQIRVRALYTFDAQKRISLIETALLRHGRFKAGGVQYGGVVCQTDASFLTTDSNRRHIWVQRFEAMRE